MVIMPKALKTVDTLVQRLHAVARDSPDLKEAAAIYEAVLPLLRDADLSVSAVQLTTNQARAKMESGIPLLQGLDLELDAAAVRDLMIRLARAIEAVGSKNGLHARRLPWTRSSTSANDSARRLWLALERTRLDIATLLPEIASGKDESLVAQANTLRLDAELTKALAQNALKPALRAWCTQLAPLVEGALWSKGFCYVCGAAALLGELQGNDQEKHLRCGSCGADWKFSRFQCMYCGNEDHDTQQQLFEETRREQQRVEACDVCKGYLKVIAAFAPTPSEMLPLEDFATLHLDYIAQERGYSRRTIR